MRKALALFLTLLLCALLCVAVAAQWVAAPTEDLRFTETAHIGDIAATAGLEMALSAQLRQHLRWDSTLRYDGAQPASRTDFTFSQAQLYPDATHVPTGITLSDALYLDPYSRRNDAISQAYADLLAETEPGTTGRRMIRLADYYSYYPLAVDIDLPGYTSQYAQYWSDGDEPIDAVTTTLLDAIRIPMLEDQYYILSIDKNVDGSSNSSGGSSAELGDSYSIYANSVLGDNACYFWFSNRTNQGHLVDTSHISGGYGIYCLRWSGEGDAFTVEPLSVLYPVDPAAEIVYLGINGRHDRLLLHTVEGGRYLVTVLDTQTGEALQRLDITSYGPDDWSEVDAGDDYVMIRFNRRGVCVLAAGEDGSYDIRIQVDFQPQELDADCQIWNSYWSRQTAFDGQRLAVAGILEPDDDRQPVCGFYLAVYDASGLRYYGEYTSSLDDANQYAADYSDRIQPDYNSDAVRLNWTK